MSAVRRDFAAHYDGLIFGPVMRSLYGDAPYYNVGDWSLGAASQAQACEHLMDRVLRLLEAPAGRLLDCGCGLGAGTRTLAERFPGATVVGVNLSPRQARFAAGHSPRAAFACMDAAELAFGDGAFGAVVCVEAALHFDTRLRFLEEALRVLAPGGTLVLTDLLVHTGEWIGARTVPPANVLPGLDQYRSCCEEAGFSVEALEDITDVTFRAYAVHLRRWAEAECPPADRTRLHQLADHLGGLPASYLAARLRKRPAPGARRAGPAAA